MSFPRQAVEAAAGDLPVDVSLTKPVRNSELHETLLNLLLLRRGGHRAPLVAAEAAAPKTPGDHPLHPGLRVLLVEDNIVNQQVAMGFLEGMGCAVTVAGNGRAALAAVEAAGFDLVLMDCMMPEMDGYEATAEIRRLEHARGGGRTPIVALTASAMSGERERCLAAGMDDYLGKPIRQEQLWAMLSKWRPAAAAVVPPGPAAAAPSAPAPRRLPPASPPKPVAGCSIRAPSMPCATSRAAIVSCAAPSRRTCGMRP